MTYYQRCKQQLWSVYCQSGTKFSDLIIWFMFLPAAEYLPPVSFPFSSLFQPHFRHIYITDIVDIVYLQYPVFIETKDKLSVPVWLLYYWPVDHMCSISLTMNYIYIITIDFHWNKKEIHFFLDRAKNSLKQSFKSRSLIDLILNFSDTIKNMLIKLFVFFRFFQ